tara:strand:+ start:232 stop:651 length:420 start_codon:yes stop_codon:yes gene_type:complete
MFINYKKKNNSIIALVIFLVLLFFYIFNTNQNIHLKCDIYHLTRGEDLPFKEIELEIIQYDIFRKYFYRSFGEMNLTRDNFKLNTFKYLYYLRKFQSLHFFDIYPENGGIKKGTYYIVSKNFKIDIKNEEYHGKCRAIN